jgi:hypothetical protein
MWKFYLQMAAAGFYTGHNQLWQIVYSKQPLDKVYEALRTPEIVGEWEQAFQTGWALA